MFQDILIGLFSLDILDYVMLFAKKIFAKQSIEFLFPHFNIHISCFVS